MGRLHLKETPEERREKKKEKQRRKSQKSERKSDKYNAGEEPARKRHRTVDEQHTDSCLDEDVHSRAESSRSSTKPSDAELRAEIEERLFREKLFDAMQDDYDARLDGVEAQLNEYAHVPRRWQAGGSHTAVSDMHVDVNIMEEEEYTEWIREGMWRRTHKQEAEERERRQAERTARKMHERKVKEETKRLAREQEAERTAKRILKERRRKRDACDVYEKHWRALLTESKSPDMPLRFNDIPWPLFTIPSATESLTPEGISEFILYGLEGEVLEGASRTKRETVREALLKWHPDKFEGKLGTRLDDRDKASILEGVGIVARCLNEMMGDGSGRVA